jgi:hypothetical protein
MKPNAFTLSVFFIFFGFILPLRDASSQESPGRSPSAEREAGLAPNKIDLLIQLQHEVERNPQNAPDIVTKAIQADPQHSIFYAGEVVRSAILGLGNPISEIAIAFLIAAAVNARPQAALQIVRVAVGVTPPKLHTAIVAAAVADVPDPYEEVVIVRRREGSAEPSPSPSPAKANVFIADKAIVSVGRSAISDGKSVVAGGKAVATEGKEAVGPEILAYEPSTGPGSMTLAEAIIQAAIEGGSTVGLDTLAASVNFILLNWTTPPLGGDPADPNTIITKSPPGPLPTPAPTPPPVSP